MPECPFCGEYYFSDSEVNSHVISQHQDKVLMPDDMRKMVDITEKLMTGGMEKLAGGISSLTVVLRLTELALVHNIPKEKVFETFRYFFDCISREEKIE